MPRAVIEQFEAGAAVPSEDDLDAMRVALEGADIEFFDDRGWPTARLRK